MPLPPAGPREELHVRQIDMRGYRRADGLFEVDARVNDRKTYTFSPPGAVRVVEPGEFIHDMWVRMVLDETFTVQDMLAASDTTPYPICKEATETLKKMIGARVAAGWTMEVKRRLGGVKSCTHLMELLIPMGTAAYQSMSVVRMAQPDLLNASGRPQKIDTCLAYAGDREVVLRRWPQHYTGPRKTPSEVTQTLAPATQSAD